MIRGAPDVDVLEAERRLRDGGPHGPLLVDVREVVEFVGLRAPGAVLLPMSSIAVRLDELPRDRELLFICRSGARSGQVATYLAATGWPAVANVAGGMLAWQRAGLPVRSGSPDPGEGLFPAKTR